MKPFECLGDDGLIHLHHDNWHRWKDERLSVHPGEGKWRFDLQLEHPRSVLEMVPVTNSNVHGSRTPHTCFYECDDWSTIYGAHLFEVNDGIRHHLRRPMFRMIVESQNPEPLWGERITLLSTSTYFKCESWGRNTPNQFAYFRGRYWQVTFSELLPRSGYPNYEFPAGVGYPLRDGRGMIPRRDDPLREYIHAPYIPFDTPVVIDPEVLRNNRGILTRYGLRLIRHQQYYGYWSSHQYPQPEFKLDWRKYGF